MSSRTLGKNVGVGKFVTGTYTGDNGATQAIVDVGFQPKYLFVYPQLDNVVLTFWAQKSDRDGLNTDIIVRGAPIQHHYETDQIISLDADGFTVGDGTGGYAAANVLNVAARIYTFVAFG